MAACWPAPRARSVGGAGQASCVASAIRREPVRSRAERALGSSHSSGRLLADAVGARAKADGPACKKHTATPGLTRRGWIAPAHQATPSGPPAAHPASLRSRQPLAHPLRRPNWKLPILRPPGVACSHRPPPRRWQVARQPVHSLAPAAGRPPAGRSHCVRPGVPRCRSAVGRPRARLPTAGARAVGAGHCGRSAGSVGLPAGSVGRSGGQAVDRAAGRPVGRMVGGSRAVGRSVCRSGRLQSVGRMGRIWRSIGRPGGRAVDRAVGRPVGRSVAWAGSLAVGRSDGRACGRATWPVGMAGGQSVGRAASVPALR